MTTTMTTMSKPVLVWELLETRTIDNSLDPEIQQVIEISRARVHQGWLVMIAVYTGERVVNATVTSVVDENYQWDGNSHRE